MLITLSNEELETAVKQYLGTEYNVTGINFVISRKGGASTKAEVTATRTETLPWEDKPEEEVIDITIEKPSLFTGGHNG